MTLATVPRYDGDRISGEDGSAVVVGASVAGLLAARVLADAYGSVTVVDRDPLPDDPLPRRGVPQARHPHVLLEAGRATMEDLLPGYGEDLVEAGGMMIDIASEFDHYVEGGFLADGRTRRPMYAASRPLFERTLRGRVAAVDGVELRPECQFADYLVDDGATTVEGVAVRDGDAGREELRADLVVDATGRTSRTPDWLADHGYEAPPVDEVAIDIAYSSALVERPPGERDALFAPAAPPHTRGGGLFPVEGGRWLVNLHGVHGDHPPTDPEGFAAFAASLPVDDLRRVLDDSPVLGEIHHHPFPSNRRNRYEELDRFPDGLLVTGDAITSFNPIYGQGMSVAALEALQLHHALAGGREDLARRFFDRAAEVVDVAWLMATGADLAFPRTDGTRPRGVGLFNRYLSRLARKAHSDGALTDAYYRVVMMERPPTSLLRPGIAWRTLGPGWPPAAVPRGDGSSRR